MKAPAERKLALFAVAWPGGLILFVRWRSRAWESKALVQYKSNMPIS